MAIIMHARARVYVGVRVGRVCAFVAYVFAWRESYLDMKSLFVVVVFVVLALLLLLLLFSPQSGAADAEIKVPSGENTELKRSPLKAWSRSVQCHTCYAYCQGFLPCLFLPFRSIYLHFSQNLSLFLLCCLWLIHSSCVGPQNEIGRPAGCGLPCCVPAEYK